MVTLESVLGPDVSALPPVVHLGAGSAVREDLSVSTMRWLRRHSGREDGERGNSDESLDHFKEGS
jgi:hypothetical protein